MLQIDKKKYFIELGKFLSQFSLDNNCKNEAVLHNDLYFDRFVELIHLSQSHNGWFTPEQVYFSVQSWANALTEDNLDKWLSNYNLIENEPKTVSPQFSYRFPPEFVSSRPNMQLFGFGFPPEKKIFQIHEKEIYL